jgi:hypothetical protein
MRQTGLMIFPILLGSVVLAQQESQGIKVNIENFRYPALAASVRIQGDVIFEVSASGHRLVSGHPLLAPAAERNLGTWTLPPIEDGKYTIHFHFQLLDAGTKQETVLIGDKFDRFFLRLVRAPTKRIVTYCYNDPATEPQTRYTVREEGSDYIIDVFVFALPHCLPTVASAAA